MKVLQMKNYMLAVVISLVFTAAVQAGYVEFTNGDRLTGKIVRLTDSELVIESELAGTVTVDLDQVVTFSSDEPLEIHFEDGTVIRQPVKADQPGKVTVDETDILAARSLQINQIASINPPEKPAPRWTGMASAGVNISTGNTRSENFSVSTELERRGEDDRITLGGDYARGKQEDAATGTMRKTEDWWRARGKYDYFITDRLYAYGSGRYRTDDVAGLDYRLTAGGGGGYQWIETDRTTLSTEAGLAHITENYVGQDSTDELAAELAYNLRHRINDRIRFLSSLNYFPEFDDLSEYYLTTTQELRVALTDRMFTNFRVIFDYDSTPGPGISGTDVKYILGAGLEF